LYFSGIFENIEVLRDNLNGKNYLIFKFYLYPKIKKIKLNCKRCRKLQEFLKNSPFNENLKNNLEETIRSDLRRKGYFNPEFSFSYKEGVLQIDVKEGTLKIIKDVFIESKNNLNIKELIELKGKYYEEEKILKEIKKIEKKYKKEFPLIKISLKEKIFQDGGVLLKFEVSDFERIRFTFGKNLKKKEKNKIIKKIKEENSGIDTIPFILEEYKNNLVKKGFRNANVYFKRDKDFFIDIKKGEIFYLLKINFKGNNSFKEGDLLKNLGFKTGEPFDLNKINDFLDYIKYYYIENGFWDVELSTKEELEKNGIILNILINEGRQLICSKLNIYGYPEGLVLPVLNVKEGMPLRKSDVEKDLQNFQKILNDNGYYYAKVSFKIEDTNFNYIIDAGENFKIKKIIYKGLYNVNLRDIRNEIKIKEGLPFSFKNLIDLQGNIFSTSLFSSVNIKPEHNFDKENTVNINIELKEAPPITYSYGIGYDSYDRFRLQFSFSHINFLNKRYILGFEGRLFSNQQMWRLSLRDPTFLNSNFPLFLGTYRSIEKRPSFSLKRWGTVVEITRNFGKKTQATLRYDYQIQIPFDKKENFPIPKEEEEKKESAISLIYLNDTRDDIFFPKKGNFFSSEFKYSFPLLFADTNFLKIVMQYSLNLNFEENTIFAFSTRVGWIKNYKKENVPIGERLFLGGRNTLRAYSYDSVGLEGDTVLNGAVLGGNMSFLLNLEGRQLLSKSFGLTVFTDFGQVFSSYKVFDFKDIVGGYGIGSFFLTPIGPLRVEIAKKFKSVEWDDDVQWYFSFGFPF